LAGFNHGITGATIKTAALFAHEKTFCAYFDRLTEHGPSLLYCTVSKLDFSIQVKKKPGHNVHGQNPQLGTLHF
jgi:hypothetical protein